MTSKHLTIATIAAAVMIAVAPSPADAGGSFGIAISNHGLSIGFGTSNWGIWGSTWDPGHVSVGFNTALDGYGEWVWVDGLGRVWRPSVAASWRPYSHGRWVWTSMGWTWVAYEPWGWMPHHYGNWAYSTVGWVWNPGHTYHPGNVVWVSSGNYYGWYPCAPRGWSHAHRAYRHGWNDGYAWGRHDGYNNGYADGWRDARYATWVPRSKVMSDNLSHHVVGHEAATRAVARSRVTPLAAPPSKHEVERMVGREVPRTRVVERTTKVDGRDVRVVRPEGQSETVRRHSADTVKRALSPTVQERAARPEPNRSASPPTTTTTRRREVISRTPSVDNRSVASRRSSPAAPSTQQRRSGETKRSSSVTTVRRHEAVTTRSVTTGSVEKSNTTTRAPARTTSARDRSQTARISTARSTSALNRTSTTINTGRKETSSSSATANRRSTSQQKPAAKTTEVRPKRSKASEKGTANRQSSSSRTSHRSRG